MSSSSDSIANSSATIAGTPDASSCSSPALLPRRIYAECYSNGRMMSEAAIVVKELQSRISIKEGHELEVESFTIEDVHKLSKITEHDLAVGNPKFMKQALNALGVDSRHLVPPDYPECLKHLLHRRIWTSTLGELEKMFESEELSEDYRVFVKPAGEAKVFNGESIGKEEASLWLPIWRESLPASFSVHCSEVVEMIAEYRAYVCDGEVRSICQYIGKDDATSLLDKDVIQAAAKTLAESDEGLRGCGMDFAVVKNRGARTEGGGEEEAVSYVTALIEVNDGINTGAYDGVSESTFSDMVIARWNQLLTYRRK